MNRSVLRAAPMALACLALGCGSSTSVKVTPIAAGTQCPNGGVSITVDNGTPQVVCNGTNGTNGNNGTNGVDGGNGTNGTNGTNGVDGGNGFTSLVLTTTLPVGDSHCASGGVRIDTGLDDGAHGGTANDGMLQTGEITSTSYVCNGIGTNVGSLTPPPGAAGNSTILAVGGAGAADAGNGGNGATIRIYFNNGTEGGHLEVFQTGAADPSFTFPAKPSPELGSNPAIITANTTLGDLQSDAGVGTLFINQNDAIAILTDADGGSAQITGLSIAAGATLTRNPGVTENANIIVRGPCLNAGTIELAVGAVYMLNIECMSYYGDTGSQVLANGIDGPSAEDGASSPGIYLAADAMVNKGNLQARGGNGVNGGAGGQISIVYVGGNLPSGVPAFNSGTLDSRGGNGQAGSGGNGGAISLQGSGDMNNSGPLDSSGGAGAKAGGQSGIISIYGGDDFFGSLRNSGTLTSNGGSVTAGCVLSEASPCQGGSSSGITLETLSGTLVNNAALSAQGGTSATGPAGTGGGVNITSYYGYAYNAESDLVPAGDIHLSGNINASGGSGLNGGQAGAVTIEMDPQNDPNGQQIILYGYARLDASGGAGVIGGNANAVIMQNNYWYTDGAGGVAYGRGGSVVNYASLAAKGGAAAEGQGGSGGSVDLQTQSNYYFSGDGFEQVISAGPIDVSAGAGQAGGNAGTVYMYGLDGISNTGAINARGGAGSATVGGSGSSEIYIASDNGPVTNTATLDASGGAGLNQGGQAGWIYLIGSVATDSGQLLAAGGAATGATFNGGSGGGVFINSSGGGFSAVTVAAPGGISVAGGAAGTGGVKGTEGQIEIDNWNVTSAWTH